MSNLRSAAQLADVHAKLDTITSVLDSILQKIEGFSSFLLREPAAATTAPALPVITEIVTLLPDGPAEQQ
jgi:hypothetical protein